MKKLKYKDGDVVYGIKILKIFLTEDYKKCLFLCPICNREKITWRNNLLRGNVKSCGCDRHHKRKWKPHKFLDLTGQFFGDLQVIQRDFTKPKRVNFLCRCKCGTIKSIFSHYLTYGKSKTCGCSKHSTGEKHNAWKGCGNITGHYFAHIRGQARIRKLEFEITVEELWNIFQKQNGKCNLTGLPIDLFINRDKTRTASLDRIDNTKGYTNDNIQWVHKDINYMKRVLSQEQLITYCHMIAEKYPKNLTI
jgi:hypothetical protein